MKYQWGKSMRWDSSYFAHMVIEHHPWPSRLPMSWVGLPGSPGSLCLKPFSHPLRSLCSVSSHEPPAPAERRPDLQAALRTARGSEVHPSQPPCRHWGPACWPDAHCRVHGTEEKLCIWLMSWFPTSLLHDECLCTPTRWLRADGSRASLGNFRMGHWLTEVPTRRSEGHTFQPSLSLPGQAREPTIRLIAAVLWGFAETLR